ncbi:ABC transporter ATP-binding protein [Salipaludibacillus aurantiacus]|uniref:Putative ABC transport system ATP-binding protein n=1 Tax=Salipaludibacillus aurantiacus TaxID=1601833 RepID=A0A1H9R6T1_9BACI|nr:phosphate ABC transporter ATP-binding protein [Salipaludibacillus aurantiacus]SER68432.1 putative ABC transport system ATP-binding protein [Salipaludibacillus aurantiacus]
MGAPIPVLEASNVQSDFLRNINFNVSEGEIITLIGPSGAGKSSLLKLLNRLADPETGQIFFYNKNIKEYKIEQLRKRIGMVFQSSSLFEGTVEDNLKFGPSLFNEWEHEEGKKLLEIVKLPTDFLSKDVRELSGGEQQRVAFARTLANRPEVLLLDEVTSALDVKNVEVIEQFIKGIVSKEVKAVLMVTHDIKQAKRLGDRTFFMYNREIVEQGDTRRLLTDPQSGRLQAFLKE